MKLDYLSKGKLQTFINHALAEDVGSGDHSSLASIPAQVVKKAQLISKDSGTLAGVELAEQIFKTVDKNITLNILKTDGDKISKGDKILTVEGSAQNILTAERLVLNCMQRMSGTATYTNHLQSMISHTDCKLLDTRKTTPNFRICEKWAVAIGGGMNHRFGLYDMIILKDNHIDFCGGITKAVEQCRAYLQKQNLSLKIEVETRNLKEVEEALSTSADRIMLDNMSTDMMREAVALVNKKTDLEASGGVTENNIVSIAETGVDFISCGALTHSYKSLDLSLKAI